MANQTWDEPLGQPTNGAANGAVRLEDKESACKPGSVENNHSSRPRVTAGFQQPTRKARGPRVAPLRAHPSLFGLAPNGVCRAANRYRPRGALLPHLFTLTGADCA